VWGCGWNDSKYMVFFPYSVAWVLIFPTTKRQAVKRAGKIKVNSREIELSFSFIRLFFYERGREEPLYIAAKINNFKGDLWREKHVAFKLFSPREKTLHIYSCNYYIRNKITEACEK
jgi:hypothetical protein